MTPSIEAERRADELAFMAARIAGAPITGRAEGQRELASHLVDLATEAAKHQGRQTPTGQDVETAYDSLGSAEISAAFFPNSRLPQAADGAVAPAHPKTNAIIWALAPASFAVAMLWAGSFPWILVAIAAAGLAGIWFHQPRLTALLGLILAVYGFGAAGATLLVRSFSAETVFLLMFGLAGACQLVAAWEAGGFPRKGAQS